MSRSYIITRYLYFIALLFITITILISCIDREDIEYVYKFIQSNELDLVQNEFMILNLESIEELSNKFDSADKQFLTPYTNEFFEINNLLLYYTESEILLNLDSIKKQENDLIIKFSSKDEQTIKIGQILLLEISNDISFNTINTREILTGIYKVFEEEEIYWFSTINYTLVRSHELNEIFLELTEQNQDEYFILKSFDEYHEYKDDYRFLLPNDKYAINNDDFLSSQLIIIHYASSGIDVINQYYNYKEEILTFEISISPISIRESNLEIFYLFISSDYIINNVILEFSIQS